MIRFASIRLIVSAFVAALALPLSVQAQSESLLQEAGVLEVGDETLNDGSLYDAYAFKGAGQAVVISVKSKAFDTYLHLVDGDGQTLATNNDWNGETDSTIGYVLPADGDYQVWVNAFEVAGRGAYEVSLSVTAADNPIVLESRADRLFQAGIQQFKISQFREALASWQAALEIYREIGDRASEGHALVNLGGAYLRLGQYQNAIELYDQSLEIAREIGDRSGEGRTLGALGVVYDDLGQYQNAIELSEQALEIMREISDHASEGMTLVNLGVAYRNLGQYQNAIELYEQALEIMREIGDHTSEGITLGNLGHVHLDLGEYQRAIELFRKQLEITREIENRDSEGEALVNLGNAYFRLGQYQNAIELYDQSLEIERERGDLSDSGDTLGQLGNAYAKLGEYQRAIKLYEQVLEIAREIGDRSGEGVTLANLGTTYENLSQYQRAIEFFQQSLEIMRAIGDRSGEGTVLGNLGVVYDNLGQYQHAIELFEKNLEIAREIRDHNSEGRVLGNLGVIYNSLGQYQRAIVFFQQSLKITRAIGDRGGEGRTLSNLGSLYNDLKQHQRAIEIFEQQLAIIREISDRTGEGIALGNLGLAYRNLGQYQRAIALFQQGLEIMREIGDRRNEGRTLINLGNASLNLGQYQKAIDLYEQALALYKNIESTVEEGITAERGIVLANLGHIHHAQEKPELAIIFLKESVNVRETIRGGIQGLSSELQQSYTNTVSDDYRLLADLLISEGRFLEAIQTLELLKAEEIKEYTRGTVANLQTEKINFSPVETNIIQKHNSLITLGLNIYNCEQERAICTQENLSALYEDRTALTTEWNNLITQLEQTLEATAPNPRDLITEGVAEVLEAQPNTALIYPAVLNDQLVLLWATRGGIANAIEVPQAQETDINNAAFEFRSLMRQCEIAGCTTQDIPAIQAVAQQFHQWLLPQDLDDQFQQAGIENLVFALDQQLRYIPVAALHNGDQYLMERYTLSTVTAAWLTPTANPLPANADEVSVLALGLSDEVPDRDPTDDVPYFAPLAHVAHELDGIVQSSGEGANGAGIYPGKSLLNQAFDDSAFSSLKIDGHQILHIATHGLFVPTDLYSSFLMLGTQEDWRISEMQNIGQQFTDLSLVVLSACETALGGNQQSADEAEALDGKEISGIAQTFLDAGVDAIIASLWKVSDGSTSALMQQFYLELAKGSETDPMTFAKALQQAQMSVLTGELDPSIVETLNRGPVDWAGSPTAANGDVAQSLPDLSHPFYWAPFTLIGNGL